MGVQPMEDVPAHQMEVCHQQQPIGIPIPAASTGGARATDATAGHTLRQLYFAFFWTIFAIMSYAVPSKVLMDSHDADLKNAGFLTMLGAAATSVLCWGCVLAGCMAKRSKVMKDIGLALLGAHSIAVIIWAAGYGNQINLIFNQFDARDKIGLVGRLLTVLFMGISFTIICAKDYTDTDTDTGGGGYQDIDQSEGSLGKVHVVGQLWHLFALVIFLTLVVGVPYGGNLSSPLSDVKTSARLAVAGVCLSILSATVVTIVIFVDSPRHNVSAATLCFVLMATLFVGSILLLAGMGKELDTIWGDLGDEDKASAIGTIISAFGFTTFYILYCLPVSIALLKGTYRATNMGSGRTVGHTLRQLYFAFFWTILAIMSYAVPGKDLMKSPIPDLSNAGYLTMLGAIGTAALCWVCVLAGCMAKRSKVMKSMGLALLGAHSIAVLLWVAGYGNQVSYMFDELDARTRTGLVGHLLTVLFMGISFTIICAKDYTDTDTDTGGGGYQDIDQSEGSLGKVHVVGQLWHLFALFIFLTLVVGVPYGGNLSSPLSDVKTSARLAVSGVCFSILSATAVTIVIFVASPRHNVSAATLCFVLMATLFVGSILLLAGMGKDLDIVWGDLGNESRVSAIGTIMSTFAFTTFYILYCLPGVGILM